jgi:hypothetical protein
VLFTAPGNLQDFQTDDQRAAWSKHIDVLFNQVIGDIAACTKGGTQFVNPTLRDISSFSSASVQWASFPNSLLGPNMSRPQAYELLDKNTREARNAMDEYLEWYVHFDGQGNIVAVDFTTETEFYWRDLYRISQDLAAQKYSEVLGAKVRATDIGMGGRYNPHNEYNSTKGIVHLVQQNNTLDAELYIAANASIWRTDTAGKPITDVVTCKNCGDDAGLGEPRRNSDPLIASSINALAREGRALSIPNPVGLYIASLNTQGWKTPDGSDVSACWKITRGNPAVRARFEAPNSKFAVSDIRIGDQPIRHAAQIAEHVMVTLSAAAGPANEFENITPLGCKAFTLRRSALKPTLHRKTRALR